MYIQCMYTYLKTTLYRYMYVWTTVGNLGHMRLCLEAPKEKEDYCRQTWTHETIYVWRTLRKIACNLKHGHCSGVYWVQRGLLEKRLEVFGICRVAAVITERMKKRSTVQNRN